MFDRLRKVLRRDPPPTDSAPATRPAVPGSASASAFTPVSEWAALHGQPPVPSAPTAKDVAALALHGEIEGRPWRLEVGRPSRKYIRGAELRARAELGIDGDVLLLLLNRPLKEALERQAYALFTDDLQTQADPNLPEEMRLVAMHQETGWPELPGKFWERWALVADDAAQGQRWLDARLAGALLEGVASPDPQVPFMLMLLRGKAYLRTEPTGQDPAALQHAASLFTLACSNALRAFRTRG